MYVHCSHFGGARFTRQLFMMPIFKSLCFFMFNYVQAFVQGSFLMIYYGIVPSSFCHYEGQKLFKYINLLKFW